VHTTHHLKRIALKRFFPLVRSKRIRVSGLGKIPRPWLERFSGFFPQHPICSMSTNSTTASESGCDTSILKSDTSMSTHTDENEDAMTGVALPLRERLSALYAENIVAKILRTAATGLKDNVLGPPQEKKKTSIPNTNISIRIPQLPIPSTFFRQARNPTSITSGKPTSGPAAFSRGASTT
jgi:hypothetical protein